MERTAWVVRAIAKSVSERLWHWVVLHYWNKCLLFMINKGDPLCQLHLCRRCLECMYFTEQQQVKQISGCIISSFIGTLSLAKRETESFIAWCSTQRCIRLLRQTRESPWEMKINDRDIAGAYRTRGYERGIQIWVCNRHGLNLACVTASGEKAYWSDAVLEMVFSSYADRL